MVGDIRRGWWQGAQLPLLLLRYWPSFQPILMHRAVHPPSTAVAVPPPLLLQVTSSPRLHCGSRARPGWEGAAHCHAPSSHCCCSCSSPAGDILSTVGREHDLAAIQEAAACLITRMDKQLGCGSPSEELEAADSCVITRVDRHLGCKIPEQGGGILSQHGKEVAGSTGRYPQGYREAAQLQGYAEEDSVPRLGEDSDDDDGGDRRDGSSGAGSRHSSCSGGGGSAPAGWREAGRGGGSGSSCSSGTARITLDVMLPPPPAPVALEPAHLLPPLRNRAAPDLAPEPTSPPRSSASTAALRQSHFSVPTLGAGRIDSNLGRPLLPASSLTAAHPSSSQGQASEPSQLTSVVDGMMYGGTGEDGGEDEASSCADPAGASSSFYRQHDSEIGAGGSSGWGASSSCRRTVTDDSATAAWRVSPQPLLPQGRVGGLGGCDEAISKLGPALPRPSERPHVLRPRAGSPALPPSEARSSSVLLGSPLSAAVALSVQQQLQQQRGSGAGARRNLGAAMAGQQQQQQKGIGAFSLAKGKGQQQQQQAAAPEPPPVAVVSKMDILERLRKVGGHNVWRSGC